MRKHFTYALAAALYIVLIVFLINKITTIIPGETIVIPMVMLSLFVLSAAVMGFLFFSEPIFLFIENKKHEAIVFFGKTVGIFACFVIIFIVLLFLR